MVIRTGNYKDAATYKREQIKASSKKEEPGKR